MKFLEFIQEEFDSVIFQLQCDMLTTEIVDLDKKLQQFKVTCVIF